MTRKLSSIALLLTLVACPRDQVPAGDAGQVEPGAPAPTGQPAAGQPGTTYPGTLAAVREHRRLRVLTTPGDRGYLPRAGTPLGFEREMAAKLAAELGVELELVQPPSYQELIPWLLAGRADLIAATLTATPERATQVAFSVPLQHVREVLVGPLTETPIDALAQLDGKTVVVRRSSSFWGTLEKLGKELPGLKLEAADEKLDTETLIEQVGQGDIPYTVADSNLAEAMAGFREDLRVMLPLSEPRPLGWAVAPRAKELLARVNGFLARSALTGHQDQAFTGDLDGIRKRGALRMLTRNNAINYWLYRGQEVGFEYELAKAFADKLGLRLEIVIPPEREDLLPWLQAGKGDLIAAGLTVTPERQKQVAFASPNLLVREVVVMRAGTPIERPEDLAGHKVHVRKSSAYFGTLQALSKTLARPIQIVPTAEDEEFEDAVRKVAEGLYELTVLDSHLAEYEVRGEPRLAIGPALTEEQSVAWGLRKGSVKLKAAADAFFGQGDFKPRGLMYNILRKRYFESARAAAAQSPERSDKAGVISPYDALLRRHAKDFDLDWRLLAAQMYQESRFDPEAKSWVGALGLMQIMPATGKELGVADLRKPEDSVRGGAKYMRKLVDRFDKTLPFKDRYRFALASYNAGPGHVDDARRLAAQLKLDPDRWFGQVEKAMLKLEEPRYARKARYGFCRGREPVGYVSKIQTRFEAYSKLVEP